MISQEEFLAFYELHFWRHNKIPNWHDYWNVYQVQLSEEEYYALCAKPEVFKHLLARELPLPSEVRPRLKPKQLELIAALTDPASRQTLSQRLKAVEVSSVQYNNWLNDPLFAEILHEETSKLTANARTQVLHSLASQASSGNVQAQKLYLEMSGEYTPKAVASGDGYEFKQMTFKLLEVLKKYVDEDTLLKVTLELEELLFGVKTPNVRPALRRAPKEINEFSDFFN